MKRKTALLLALALLINAVCVAAALADEKTAQFNAYEFPEITGTIVKAAHYADATGANIVLLTETEITETEDETQSKELFAYNYRLKKDGTVARLWQMTDYVRGCDSDALTVSFITEAFRITDLDNSGQVEVWMPYVLQCAGDPGPMTMKIIMYEDGREYTVRGETRSRVDANEFAGGEYELGEAFASSPKEFASFAGKLWMEHRDR